ncbi:MAG: sulfatase [Kiritimatiellae bacterium]|nr:sulfatase [Kiritimatiellia bacterium]
MTVGHTVKRWTCGAAAIAALALVLAACSRKPAPTDGPVVYNLAERLPHAGTEIAWTTLDVTSPEARPYLVDGWGEVDETEDGTPTVWTTSRLARVQVFLPQTRDLVLTARCYPYARSYADQIMTVLVNGRKAARIRLERGSTFRDYEIPIPHRLLRLGENEIIFKARYVSSRHRTAIRFTTLALAGLPAAEASEVKPEPVGSEWRQQAGTRVAWRIVVPEDGYVRCQPVFTPSARVDLWRVQLRLGGELMDLASGKSAPDKPLTVSLARHAGARGVLEFEVFGSSPVTWRKAEVGGIVNPRHVNMVVFTIDSLRADHVGAYGYPRPTTPVLDQLAQRGALLLNAYANSVESAPSHATLLNGRYPQSHGLITNSRALDRQQITLADILSDHGYRTAAYVNFWVLKREQGAAKGFQTRRVETRTPDGPDMSRLRRNVFGQALRWVRYNWEKPHLLWIHSQYLHMDDHLADPYARMFWDHPATNANAEVEGQRFYPLLSTKERNNLRRAYNNGKTTLTAEELDAIRAYYDGNLRLSDDCVGAFLQGLRDYGLDPFTALVITADHGVSLGERDCVRHMGPPYDHLLRVPLIMVLPGVNQAPGARIEGLAELADVTPTLLAYAGITPPRRMQGGNLLPALQDPSLPTKPHVYAIVKDEGYWYSIRSAAARYLMHTSGKEYFTRDFSDRDLRSTAKEHPEERDALKQLLLHWVKDTPDLTAETDEEVPAEVLKMLRKAGYLDGRQ